MTYQILIAALLLPFTGLAQEGAARQLVVRAFLNAPMSPQTKFYVHDKPDNAVPLILKPGELPVGQVVTLLNDRLVIFNAQATNPDHPDAGVAASVTVPERMARAVAIIQPRPAGIKPGFGVVLVDDSLAAFPGGESRIVTLVSLQTAAVIGENQLRMEPGKITPVPPVNKLDPYNMAQTSFYYKVGEKWTPFSEAKMKYIKSYRHIFISYVRPGGKNPLLTTLIDEVTIPKPTKP